MPKKQRAKQSNQPDGYVTVSTGGFPPNWTPEEDGEAIEVVPIAIRAMKQQKGKKGMKQGYVFDACLIQAQSESFTQGSGKNQVQIEVKPPATVSINLNAGLMGETEGERKIAYIGKAKNAVPEFTNLSQSLMEKNKPCRLVYHGSVPLGGGRSVKRFEIQVPQSLLTS